MENIISESITVVDVFVTSVFLLVTFVVAYVYGRGISSSAFLISEHKLGYFQTMATINASKTGAVLIAYTAMIFVFGIQAVWFMVGVILGYILFLFFGTYLKRKYPDKYAITDYFGELYGKTTQKLVGLVAAAAMFGFVVLNIVAIGFTIQFVLAVSFQAAVIIGVAVVAVYIVLGGFDTVVKTDVIQYILILTILVLLPVLLFMGGVPITSISLEGVTDLSFMNLIGFMVLGTLIPFGTPELWQRVFAAKSTTHFQKGFALAAIVYALFAFLLTIVAVYLKTTFPALPPDAAFVGGLSNVLPGGLLWFISVLLLAAIMSSLDTYVYTTASSIVHAFRSNTNENDLRISIRYGTVLVCILGTVGALTVGSVVNAMMFLAITSILGIVAIVSWVRPQINKTIIQGGIVVGIVVFVYNSSIAIRSGSTVGTDFVLVTAGSVCAGCLAGLLIMHLQKPKKSLQ